MDEVKILEGLMKKPKRGEGKSDNKAAIGALMSFKKSKNDLKQLAGYLANLHFSVCQNFLLEYCQSATSDEVKKLITALLDDESIKTKNLSLYLFPKGLSAVYSLTAKKKFTVAFMVMNRILEKAEGKKGFAPSSITIFKKIFTEPSDSEGLIELCSQLESGKIKSQKEEMDRFVKYLEAVQLVEPKKKKTKEILPDLPKEDFSEKTVEQANEAPHNLLSNIEKTQVDIVAMLKELMAKTDLQKEKDTEILTLKNEVADLTERLRVALQMDDVNKNQELITLKNEITNAVKLDFADYEKSREKSHSKDLFKVYRAMLSRIFKQLKRFGIALE